MKLVDKITAYFRVFLTVAIPIFVFYEFTRVGIYNPYNFCEEGEYKIYEQEYSQLRNGWRVKKATVTSEYLTAELYEAYGVLNVYDPDGTFCYAVAIHHARNGQAEIGVAEDILYVVSRSGELFIFKDGVCLLQTAIHTFVDDPISGKIAKYEYCGDTLIREDSEGNVEQVVKFAKLEFIL